MIVPARGTVIAGAAEAARGAEVAMIIAEIAEVAALAIIATAVAVIGAAIVVEIVAAIAPALPVAAIIAVLVAPVVAALPVAAVAAAILIVLRCRLGLCRGCCRGCAAAIAALAKILSSRRRALQRLIGEGRWAAIASLLLRLRAGRTLVMTLAGDAGRHSLRRCGGRRGWRRRLGGGRAVAIAPFMAVMALGLGQRGRGQECRE